MSNELTFLTPQNAQDAFMIAENLAKSSMIPKQLVGKPNDIVVAMAYGAELGLQPLQSLQNIAVINGRPSLWGDAVRALVLNSSDLVELSEWDENGTFFCKISRKTRTGATITIQKSFSDNDAKAAGLLGKQGPWTQYKDRMKQMRAFSFAARDAYADRLRGFITREEANDIPANSDQQERDVTPQQEPDVLDSLLEQSEPEKEAQHQEEVSVFDQLMHEMTNAKDLEQLAAARDATGKAGDQLSDEQKAKLSKTMKESKQRIIDAGF